MSTVVLARKYRPRRFGEMVGQEHVVQALANALSSQRLHHAYLFTGTRGVGKTTVSRILAKSLNCTGPDGNGGITAEPCGVCRACTEIDADRFIDYVEMDAASNRGIDEIRDLLERAAYKPAVGRFKVFMIDEVHQLTKDSFNALLKTLEEPPEYLKFVLATTDPEKVLPTVLSRCLQFNLRPMAPDTVLGRLEQVLAAEHVAAEPGALRLLARAARGSMRDALSLADQAIAFGGGTLAEAGVRQMLGSVGQGHVLGLLDALVAGDGRALLAGVERLRTEGESADGALEALASLLTRIALVQASPDTQDADDPDNAAVVALAARLPADETQLGYSIALHGRAELSLAPDEYSGLAMVLLRMLAFRPAGTARGDAVPPPAAAVAPRSPAPAPAMPLARTPAAASVAVTPAAARPLPVAAPAPVVAPAPAPARAASSRPPWEEDIPLADEAPAVAAARDLADVPTEPSSAPLRPSAASWTPTPLGERWSAWVGRLVETNAVAALVRELALQSECLAIDADERSVRLRVERDSLRNPAHAERLKAALAGLLGHPVTLEVEAGVVGDTPARRDAAVREARQREAEALMLDDPLVRELSAQFKTARIVPGSVKPL